MCKQTTDNLEHIYTHLVIHEGGNAYFTNRSKWLCIHSHTRLKKKAFKTESTETRNKRPLETFLGFLCAFVRHKNKGSRSSKLKTSFPKVATTCYG